MKTISLKAAGTAQSFRILATVSQHFFYYGLRISQKILNFVTQQPTIVSLSRTGAVNARNNVGLFLLPGNADNTAAFRNSFTLVRDSIVVCCNGRQPFLLNATNHDTMKTISLKPAGTAQSFRIRDCFSKFFAKFDVAIATISAAVSLCGLILTSDLLLFCGAFAMMAAIYPSTNSKEGGEA